jgi:undecaprenyl diphosphate synthase
VSNNLVLPRGTTVPDHIGMILDGNRRWARAKGLNPWEGHKAGYEAVRKLAKASRGWGVHTFTIWAFSTENWERSREEVDKIMDLLKVGLEEFGKEAHEEKVRLVHLGRKDRFPKDITEKIIQLEKETRCYEGYVLNLALDYGGRDEILRATKKIIQDKIPVEKLDEKKFAEYLDTGDQPYPYVDLFIRTSGEQRTSGFLPWQMTYAEYFWELDHLPDMTAEKLRDAILDYSRRRRRFGGNDKEEHLKFNPRIVAGLELDWQRALLAKEDKKLSDLIIRYLGEQYGLSKTLAKEAGVHLVKALLHREKKEWEGAKTALKGLYGVVKRNLGLAMEPELVANLEVDLWRNPSEEKYRKLYAETYRVSEFQAGKAAHLAMLTGQEMAAKNWEKARKYSEMFYRALKERVA